MNDCCPLWAVHGAPGGRKADLHHGEVHSCARDPGPGDGGGQWPRLSSFIAVFEIKPRCVTLYSAVDFERWWPDWCTSYKAAFVLYGCGRVLTCHCVLLFPMATVVAQTMTAGTTSLIRRSKRVWTDNRHESISEWLKIFLLNNCPVMHLYLLSIPLWYCFI